MRDRVDLSRHPQVIGQPGRRQRREVVGAHRVRSSPTAPGRPRSHGPPRARPRGRPGRPGGDRALAAARRPGTTDRRLQQVLGHAHPLRRRPTGRSPRASDGAGAPSGAATAKAPTTSRRCAPPWGVIETRPQSGARRATPTPTPASASVPGPPRAPVRPPPPDDANRPPAPRTTPPSPWAGGSPPTRRGATRAPVSYTWRRMSAPVKRTRRAPPAATPTISAAPPGRRRPAHAERRGQRPAQVGLVDDEAARRCASSPRRSHRRSSGRRRRGQIGHHDVAVQVRIAVAADAVREAPATMPLVGITIALAGPRVAPRHTVPFQIRHAPRRPPRACAAPPGAPRPRRPARTARSPTWAR